MGNEASKEDCKRLHYYLQVRGSPARGDLIFLVSRGWGADEAFHCNSQSHRKVTCWTQV